MNMKKKASTARGEFPAQESPEARHTRAARILKALARHYPEARCALDYATPYQLLLATILSAQCTDVRVNRVTPDLFRRYPTPSDLAGAVPAAIEEIIRSTGFYRNKAKSLILASRDIAQHHGGEVPRSMEELVQLHGVARKTANVVLGNAFGENEGVVVDTHVARLARRLGLSAGKTPEKIEADLMGLFPRPAWCRLANQLIWHGRRVCEARHPGCAECPLRPDCPRIGLAPVPA